MEEALNKQINREFYSAYLYLAMSAYFESANMKGFAKWMRIQGKEEQAHALKLYDYVIARGGRVSLLAAAADGARTGADAPSRTRKAGGDPDARGVGSDD